MSKCLRVTVAVLLAFVNMASWAQKKPANTPPTVSLTSPASGSSFVAPANITLSANAADSDGSISKVEFYRGTVLLGSTTTAPYSITWSNVPAGSYTLTAKATDNAGATVTSTAVSISVTSGPSIIISSPAEGEVVIDSAYVQGTFNGDSNTTVWVENGNSTRLARNSGNNFAVAIPVFPGPNTLKITVARTDKTSDTATLAVTGNDYPKIAFITPAASATFNAPANITFEVDAVSPAGSISRVEFSRNGALLGTASAPPYRFTWNNAPVGDHGITAQAIDNYNYSSGAYINIQVTGPNALPTISLTSPASGATFTSPANITLSANAADADGSISIVEFYLDGNLLGATNSAPYSLFWPNVPAGTYSLTARAIDDRGGMATSAPASITVQPPNNAPTISLTTPQQNATFVFGEDILLGAIAADSDGSITRVEFYRGSTLLGSVNTEPYNFV